jgi:hypothetical protein
MLMADNFKLFPFKSSRRDTVLNYISLTFDANTAAIITCSLYPIKDSCSNTNNPLHKDKRLSYDTLPCKKPPKPFTLIQNDPVEAILHCNLTKYITTH